MLAVAVGADGEPARGWRLEEVVEMYKRAFNEFRESDLGQMLIARGGPDIIERVTESCSERFESTSPMYTPFYETLEAVGRDFLVDLPPAPPKELTIAEHLVKENATKRVAPAAQPQPKISTEAHNLAWMVKKQILRDGVSSLKARSGIVTVKAETGQSYQYESSLFETLYEEAVLYGELPPIGGAR